MIELLPYIILFLNILGFVMVMLDKYEAKNRLWRIPERTFFLLSILGGGIGVFLGLLIFNHKTKHWYFMTLIPFIIIIQVLFIYYLVNK